MKAVESHQKPSHRTVGFPLYSGATMSWEIRENEDISSSILGACRRDGIAGLRRVIAASLVVARLVIKHRGFRGSAAAPTAPGSDGRPRWRRRPGRPVAGRPGWGGGGGPEAATNWPWLPGGGDRRGDAQVGINARHCADVKLLSKKVHTPNIMTSRDCLGASNCRLYVLVLAGETSLAALLPLSYLSVCLVSVSDIAQRTYRLRRCYMWKLNIAGTGQVCVRGRCFYCQVSIKSWRTCRSDSSFISPPAHPMRR